MRSGRIYRHWPPTLDQGHKFPKVIQGGGDGGDGDGGGSRIPVPVPAIGRLEFDYRSCKEPEGVRNGVRFRMRAGQGT